MEISILPSDYVIKTLKENEDKTVNETIFLIKALRIRNTFEKKITIKKLKFNIKVKWDEQAENCLFTGSIVRTG